MVLIGSSARAYYSGGQRKESTVGNKESEIGSEIQPQQMILKVEIEPRITRNTRNQEKDFVFGKRGA
jgi:hypothetical protein